MGWRGEAVMGGEGEVVMGKLTRDQGRGRV